MISIKSVQPAKKHLDLPLVVICSILVLTGLVIIYDVTPIVAFNITNDKLYYFKNQLIWATLGTFALLFLSFFDFRKLLKISPFLIMASIVSLILVLIPHIGTEVNGARRWISFGAFTFQPSEFAKLALILYSSHIISKFENFKITLSDAFTVIFIPAVVVSALVFLEPDLGTSTILMLLILIIYFAGNGPIMHFALMVPAAIALMIPLIVFEPYRLKRIESFLDPLSDPQGNSYQILQILKAIVTGGLFGVGLGTSRSKFNYIPEIQTDAIFAIIVEELGAIGAILLIAAFIFLIKRSLFIAKNASSHQGKVLASAISGLFLVQIFFNIGSNVALIPLTGVPLPFISYGGSSLFVMMASVGILLNIKRQS